MTGELKYLDYAKAGVAYLREHAFDRAGGGAWTYFKGEEKCPPATQRTSQDMAYALTGIGFLYFLTLDAGLLNDSAGHARVYVGHVLRSCRRPAALGAGVLSGR